MGGGDLAASHLIFATYYLVLQSGNLKSTAVRGEVPISDFQTARLHKLLDPQMEFLWLFVGTNSQ
jgi:hypothetical protein